MHSLCMPTKTISLRIEAYERLRRARRSPDESFSDVVMRAEWPDLPVTARELRAAYDAEGAHLDLETLDRIEAAECDDAPPADKWTS